MANKKISALTGASTPLAGTEVLPIVQGGSTVKVAVSDLTAGRSVSSSALAIGSATGFNPVTFNVPSAASSTASGGGGGLQLTVGTGINIDPGIRMGVYAPGVNNAATYSWIQSIEPGFANNPLKLNPNGGDVQIGWNLVPSSAAKGINFTANTPAAGMTSQLLNWYEEGTWTPNLLGQGTGSATLSTAYGTYTRIGRQVTVKGRIELSASTLAFGAMYIDGFPFPSSFTAKSFSVGTAIAGNVVYTGQLYFFVNPNSSAAFFLTGATGAPEGTLQGTAFSSTSTVTFSVTYFI